MRQDHVSNRARRSFLKGLSGLGMGAAVALTGQSALAVDHSTAAPSIPADGLQATTSTSGLIFQLVSPQSFSRITDCPELGTANDIAIYRYTDGSGQPQTMAIPGRFHALNITLRRPLTSDLTFSSWRKLIVDQNTTAARTNLTLRLRDSQGSLLATWAVENAWPCGYSVDAAGAMTEQLTLACENVIAMAGGAIASMLPAPTLVAGYSIRLDAGRKAAGIFDQGSGFGSTTPVGEVTIAESDGSRHIVKVPGTSTIPAIVLSRPFTGISALWTWRREVAQENVDTARQNGTIQITDAQGRMHMTWAFANGWPAKVVLSVHPSGVREEITIACDTISRVV